jgi:hypothetical protein
MFLATHQQFHIWSIQHILYLELPYLIQLGCHLALEPETSSVENGALGVALNVDCGSLLDARRNIRENKGDNVVCKH